MSILHKFIDHVLLTTDDNQCRTNVVYCDLLSSSEELILETGNRLLIRENKHIFIL